MATGDNRRLMRASCPFFHRTDSKRRIVCEGVVEGSTLTREFNEKEQLDQQMDIFCCDFYKNCEIYRAVMEAKYF